MTRLVVACLMGVMIFIQASQAEADAGRFEVIPGAQVPGQDGEIRQQSILLDSATGQTWVLSPAKRSGEGPAARWVPIDRKGTAPIDAATNSADLSNRATKKTSGAKRMGEGWEHDP